MSTINKALYLALKAANVSEDMALAAAETDNRVLREIADINARLGLVEKLQWVVITGVIGLLLKA